MKYLFSVIGSLGCVAVTAASLSQSDHCSRHWWQYIVQFTSSSECGVGLCPSLTVAGGRFVAELYHSQAGAAAVQLLCDEAEAYQQRCGRPGADANNRQLLMNADDMC